jgi:predicted small lipoprotein YifL
MYKLVIFSLAIMVALVSCGFKGPLYLPNQATEKPNSTNQFAPKAKNASAPARSLLPAKIIPESSNSTSSGESSIS